MSERADCSSFHPVNNGEPFHYWTYREGAKPFMDPNEHILCKAMGDEYLKVGEMVNITVLAADVTCQRCLEWLHA